MFHYNKLKDDILNWDGVNFPTGNRDIDRFEENNRFVSINVFEPDDCLNDNKIILHRGTKNRNAKYEIDLLKVYDEDNHYHYALVKNKCRLLNCQSSSNTNKVLLPPLLKSISIRKGIQEPMLKKDVWHRKDNKQRCLIKTLI